MEDGGMSRVSIKSIVINILAALIATDVTASDIAVVRVSIRFFAKFLQNITSITSISLSTLIIFLISQSVMNYYCTVNIEFFHSFMDTLLTEEQRFEEIIKFKNHEDQGLRCSIVALCISLIKSPDFTPICRSILLNFLHDESRLGCPLELMIFVLQISYIGPEFC